MCLDLCDLRNAALVATALERREEEDAKDLFRQTHTNDPGTDAEHIRVVVLARHSRCVQVVTKRGADTAYFVGGELLALSATAEHDTQIGVAVANSAPDGRTDGWIVAALHAVRAVVIGDMTCCFKHPDEVLLQLEAGMVGPNRDA